MALSTYDSQLLSSQQQAQIAQAQKNYADAAARGDKQGMESAHNFAESIRAQAGYSGMGDGAGYVALPKHNTFDMGSVSTVDTSMLNDWKQAYIQQQQAALDKAYNDALQQLDITYNKNKAEYEGSKEDAELAFKKNMGALYDNAYKNNVLAQQQASARGLTSSAQGLAMTTSQLAQASNQAASLANDRDTAINKINLELDRLSENLNISRDTLKKNLDLDKIGAMSDAEVQYIANLMNVEQFNATAKNDFLLNSLKLNHDLNLNNINNEFTASENEKDRQHALALAQLQSSSSGGRSYGGGGYYKSSGSPVPASAQLGYQEAVNRGTYHATTLSLINDLINSGQLVDKEQVLNAADIIESTSKSVDRNTGGGKQSKPARNETVYSFGTIDGSAPKK